MYLFFIRCASIVAANIWDATEIAKENGYDPTGIYEAKLDELNHYEEVATIGDHFFEWDGFRYRYDFTRRSGCTEHRYEPFIIPD